MRLFSVLLYIIKCSNGSTRLLLDPQRFPQPGKTVLPVGPYLFEIVRYLDMGSSTRVFLAHKLTAESRIPDGQEYMPPNEPGKSLEAGVPDDIVIKCLSTNGEKLLYSIENEFRIFSELNNQTSIKKPLGLYLSPRWKCRNGASSCQYIAMTFANSDVDRLISRGELRLKPPIVLGADIPRGLGIYSFEVFWLSLGISLVDIIRKLHEAGFAHGDVRACNIALEAPKNDEVVLLDVGASKILSQFPLEVDRQKFKDRDFRQIAVLLEKLITREMVSAYRTPSVSILANDLTGMTSFGSQQLRTLFETLLRERYGICRSSPGILYKYIA